MGKDLNKKFTVSLEISTKEAEKQVKASAENIKQMLSDAMKDGIGVKDLRNMAKTINSMFEGIGKSAPLNIEENFTGKGKVADRVKLLTDALDNLSTVMNTLKTSGSDTGHFDNISSEVQDEINRLKKQKQEMQEIIDAINSPQGVHVKLSKKANEQVEELKVLKQAFVDATNAKTQLENSNLKGTPEYLSAVGKYIKAAANLKAAFEDEGLSDKGMNWVNDHGTGVLQDADNVLDKFIAQNNTMINKIKSMYSESINSINNEMEFIANPYDTLKEKVQEYADLQEKLDHEDRLSSNEYDDISAKVDSLGKYFDALDKAGDKTQEIQKILEDLQFHDINVDRAVEQLCHQLGVEIPAAAEKAESALKSNITINQNNSMSNVSNDIKDVSTEAEKLQDDISDVGEEIKKSSNEATVELEQVENKTQDVATSFKNLVDYISKLGTSPGNFFNKLEAGTQNLDEELKSILQSLNLIDSAGNIHLESIKSGFTNKGGFVSDQYTMIARNVTGSSGQPYLKKAEELQVQLANAKQDGAQIGFILDLIKDKSGKIFYEIQNTVPGTTVFNHLTGDINSDILEATDDQLKGLINTLQILKDNKLFVDYGGDNILYDKNQGFSIIDLGVKGGYNHTVSVNNTLQENLDRFVKEAFKFAPVDMQSKLQTMLADRLYDLAAGIDAKIVNPNAPTSTKQQKDVQATSAKTTATIKLEEDAHEQNAAAIDAENAALQAQIELKKKAQSMKWEAFALDESTASLKSAAGFQTLSDMEKFWKSANYEKEIDWHELDKQTAEDIIKNNKVVSHLAHEWYGPANFGAKDKLENEVLADDKIRNAALNYLYHIVKDKMSYKDDSIKNMTFDDFLNTDFTVYRGDDAPLIYGESEKLSFSFDKNFAEMWGDLQYSKKIKPKDTIGNVASHLPSELEVFVPSDQTDIYKKTGESFLDFYNKQTKEMQQEIDVGLINAEKQRVSDLLGSDFTKILHQVGKTSDFKNNILTQFQQGIIPESINMVGYEGLSNVYNNLSDMGKKLVAYYASMDAISMSLPKQFSISSYGKKDAIKMIGKDANLYNAVLNDPTGVKQHVASLTGELDYNLLNKSDQQIKAEIEAVKQHTNAIQSNAKAQQELNNAKLDYNSVEKKLYAVVENAEDAMQYKALSGIYTDMEAVHHTEANFANEIAKGHYVSDDGEVFDVSEIYNAIDNIEQKYGANLNFVKDYLNQLYGKLDSSNIAKDQDLSSVLELDDDILAEPLDLETGDEFDKVYSQLFDDIFDELDQNKKNFLESLKKQLLSVNSDVEVNPDIIEQGKYLELDTMEEKSYNDLFDSISEYEAKYGENLDYIKDYLNNVFAKYNQSIVGQFDDDLLIDTTLQTEDHNDAQAIFWELEALIDGWDQDKADFISKIQTKINDIAYDVQNNPDIISQGKFIDGQLFKQTDWAEISDLVSDFEAQYGENLDFVHNYLKQVFSKQNQEIDELFVRIDDFEDDDIKYSVQDYENAYKLQDASTQEAMNDLALFYQKYEEVQSKINSDPIDFMISSDKPTLTEIDEVKSTLEALKNKIKEISALPMVETEDDIAKMQELQVEAVALQHKLRNSLVDGVDASYYGSTYGLTSGDSELLKEFIDGPDISSVVSDMYTQLEEKQMNVYRHATQDFKNMMDNDSSNAGNEYFLQLAKQLQVQKEITAEKQQQANIDNQLEADNDVAETQQELQVEQQITEEKQKQAAITEEIVNDQKAKLDADTSKPDSYVAPGQDYALESTLQQTNTILNNILTATKEESNDKLQGLLGDAVSELNKVASGIIEHQQAQKTDTSAASAKLADPIQYKQVVDIATGSFSNLGSEVQIGNLKALADGVIKVEGAFKDANDQWQGFTVNVNESNQAVDFAINKNSAFAKSLNGASDALNQQKAQLNGVSKQATELYKSLKVNPLDTSDEATAVKDSYSKLLEVIETYKKKKNALTDDEINGLKQIQAQLMANAQAYAKLHEQSEKNSKSTYGSNVMITHNAKNNALQTAIRDNSSLAGSSILSSALNEYEASFKRLQTMYNNLKNIDPTEDDKADFKAASAECNNLRKEVENLIKSYNKLHNDPNKIGEMSIDGFVDNVDNRKKALMDYMEAVHGSNAKFDKFTDGYRSLLYTIDNGDGTFTRAKVAIDNLGTALVETAGDSERATSKLDQAISAVSKKFGELWAYAAARFGVDEIIQQVRQGVGYVKEIDSALTELKKVTSETDAVYSRFLQSMSKTAGVVGSSVSELTTMAADWSRLGYSIEDAAKLAESTAILLNVSEFENATDASEALISTMQAFQYTADESQHVVDILNEVGKLLPVDNYIG